MSVKNLSESEQLKNIADVRSERDNAISLLRRLLYATRHFDAEVGVGNMRGQCLRWLERGGFEGDVTR